MTRILGRTLRIPGFIAGMQQDVDAVNAPLGSFREASNLIPLSGGRMAVRGGSKLINTLHDDAGSPAELTHICRISAFTPIGFLVVGWSDGVNKHFAYRMTTAGAFVTGTEATSRIDLTAAPSSSWNNTTSPARPDMAELWEKIFLVDTTESYANRNKLLSIDSAGTVLEPSFDFGSGILDLKPRCVAEYNNVLFIAGYDDNASEPAIVRHSFLGRSPDAANGFDSRAWNILGAKGQAVTGMKKGGEILLVAKANELYRVYGFGRAYPGWQYQVERIQNTLGLGVANPYALEFANGHWYGVGAQGPFRTDGVRVESLQGPRERAWRLTSNPEAQFVEYHPDRDLMLFGVRQAAGLPSGIYLSAGGTAPATYPNVLWAWDLKRDNWAPDLGFGLSFFHVRAVPSTTPDTPQGTPTATAASGVSATGFTANWTNGDATAQSGYYEKAGVAGSYGLIGDQAAAATSLARTGRTSYTRYFYKLDHVKSGVRTGYSNEIEVKTWMAAPGIAAVQGDTGTVPVTLSTLVVTNSSAGATLYVQESLDGVGGWSTVYTLASAPAGDHTFTNGGGVVRDGRYYRAYTEDVAWTPPTSANSAVVNLPAEA